VAANSRYLMPALVLAAATAAWAATRLRRTRIVFELAAAAAVFEGLVADHKPAFGGIMPFRVEASSIGLGALGLVVVLAAALVLRKVHRRLGTRGLRRGLLAGTAAAVVAAAVAAGYVDQRHFNDRRYRGADATIDWILNNAASGHRVGVTGFWNTSLIGPTLPAFGPRFGNYVAFVGPIERGMLQFYKRREPFLSAVRRGRYDVMVVGRGYFPTRRPSSEELWLRSAGFVRVVESERFELMRPGRLGG
jgi:hypothetical protein